MLCEKDTIFVTSTTLCCFCGVALNMEPWETGYAGGKEQYHHSRCLREEEEKEFWEREEEKYLATISKEIYASKRLEERYPSDEEEVPRKTRRKELSSEPLSIYGSTLPSPVPGTLLVRGYSEDEPDRSVRRRYC